MRKIVNAIALVAVMLVAAQNDTVFAARQALPSRVKVEAFPGSDVELLPSPFLDAQNKNSEYLLSVEPDRLLARIRQNAGLEPKAKRYEGWEGQSIAGHSLGHYLSAVSKTYDATGDERFKERAIYIVKKLDECQRHSGVGMFAGDERYATVFDEIRRGDVRSQGFDLNGLWVPWYTLHKIFAGLLDAYRYCDDELALTVAKRLGDWGIDVTKDLTLEQFQTMLRCEYGGTNDAYYTLYAFTGDEKYLRQGDRFYDFAVLKPLNEGRDELEGRHANTQIPKIIGLAHRHEVADDANGVAAFKLADFFWDRVVHHHSYAIGGHSSGEHFGRPDVLSVRLTNSTCETCNTYNMLKLTKSLYEQTGDPSYLSFFERALYNHILASINADPGAPNSLYCYFVPLQQGAFKTWSDRENTWTCCHGTGMENHAQYNGEIFYRGKEGDKDVLYVNLLIPSKLTWDEKDATITISNDAVKVETKKDAEFVVKIRRPNNCTGGGDEEYYWVVGEKWNAGMVENPLPFVPQWKIEPTPDNPDVAAFFWGPYLYAGVVGAPKDRVVAAAEEGGEGIAVLPVVVAENRAPEELVTVDEGGAVSLRTSVGQTPLVPFYAAKQRYCAYFNFFTPDAWTRQKEEYAQRRERQLKLAETTVDFFQPGEMQPERDHNFQGQGSNAGTAFGKKWRDARGGGSMEFDMKTDPNQTTLLAILYWGGETGDRRFSILVDGVKVGEEKLDMNRPNQFFYQVYPIANPDKKDSVHVRLEAVERATVGGFFGARTILESGKEFLDQD